MTVQDVINFVSTCGFPIACCIYLMRQNAKQDEYRQKQIDDLKKSIDTQTEAVKELSTYIKGA